MTKIDQAQGSAVHLRAIDVNANSHDCTFVFFVLNGKSKQTMTHIEPVDNTFDIVNYGLPNLTYSVNGVSQQVALKPSQNKLIHAARLFNEASNRLTVASHCDGLADVVLWDGSIPGNPVPDHGVQPAWCR